jgi:hypothetical protein
VRPGGSPPPPMTPGEMLDAYLALTPEQQVRVQELLLRLNEKRSKQKLLV